MAKKVRILCACMLAATELRPDDVVVLPDDVAKQAIADGNADGNKAAVDYALSVNGGKVIDIVAELAAAEARAQAQAKVADLEARLAAAPDADKPALQAELDTARAALA